ncbi:hypothetical protein OQA88_8785 [Cercophora sp. LCS_1]
MSADFFAGYISGAIGIIIGNPLDVLKVRLQSSPSPKPLPSSATPATTPQKYPFTLGTAAPILGYGALNALLFVSYNRTLSLLSPGTTPDQQPLSNIFAAGCVGGLATFVISTPIELIKCRTQLSPSPTSSWMITKQTLQREGIRGLYFGGGVTALRDAVGYGFYFWGYELSSRAMSGYNETGRALLCGGAAGILTWASIFPLDVIKTRVQTQGLGIAGVGEGTGLLGERRVGAWETARRTYAEGGWRVFWRGLGVCSVRAFVVNAVQWGVYEWVMGALGEGRGR